MAHGSTVGLRPSIHSVLANSKKLSWTREKKQLDEGPEEIHDEAAMTTTACHPLAWEAAHNCASQSQKYSAANVAGRP